MPLTRELVNKIIADTAKAKPDANNEVKVVVEIDGEKFLMSMDASYVKRLTPDILSMEIDNLKQRQAKAGKQAVQAQLTKPMDYSQMDIPADAKYGKTPVNKAPAPAAPTPAPLNKAPAPTNKAPQSLKDATIVYVEKPQKSQFIDKPKSSWLEKIIFNKINKRGAAAKEAVRTANINNQ